MPSPSSAFLAQGTQLQRNGSLISEIREIHGPSEQQAFTEVTNHDSTGRVREWISGLIDPGSLPFVGNNLPSDSSQDGNTGFYYAFHAGLREPYAVVVASGHGTYSMLGIPSRHEKQFNSNGDAAVFNGEVKITGPVTYAA